MAKIKIDMDKNDPRAGSLTLKFEDETERGLFEIFTLAAEITGPIQFNQPHRYPISGLVTKGSISIPFQLIVKEDDNQ